MRHFLKTFLLLCGCVGTLSLAGCSEETSSVNLAVHDHYPERQVLGASVNGEASSAIGGTTCCVTVPKKWKPGLTAKVSWSVYLPVDPNDPDSVKELVEKSAVAEIQEYTQNELGSIHVHVYPGEKVRLVVARWDYGSPFYPLPRAEWGVRHEVDNIFIYRYTRAPGYFDNQKKKPTERDWEWARQWGITKDGKCIDPVYLEWEKNWPAMLEENRKKRIDAQVEEITDPKLRQKLRDILEGKRDPKKPLDED